LSGSSGHGELSAGDVGALAGVSGTQVGQWARWGYMRASVRQTEPYVYSVEDVGEAAIVAELLRRGVAHRDVHRAVQRLNEYGDWPLSEARLATTVIGPRPPRTRIALHEGGEWLVLGPRGWQAIADGHVLEDVRLRLQH
jgi:hypothetical protein